jgi:hypothetical protein
MTPWHLASQGEHWSDEDHRPRRDPDYEPPMCQCGARATRTGIGADGRPLPPRCATCHRAHDPVTQEYLRQQRELVEERR